MKRLVSRILHLFAICAISWLSIQDLAQSAGFGDDVLATHDDVAEPSRLQFKKPNKKLLITLVNDLKSYELGVSSRSQSSELATLNSIPISTFGLDVNYGGLFAISVGRSSFNADRNEIEQKGATAGSHFRFRFPWRSIYFELNYAKLTGFHSSRNEKSIGPKSGYETYPSLSAETISTRLIYASSDDRYSLASIFDQSEIQLASGGSFLWGLSLNWTRLNADTPFIPTNLRGFVGQEALITSANLRSLSALAGYGYNWRFFGSGYLFGQVLFGGGIQRGVTSTETETFSVRDGSASSRADLGLGSNGENYTYGILASYSMTANHTEKTKFDITEGQVRFFFGKRF